MGEKSYGDKKVGKNLQAIRKACNMTILDFAYAMGMSESKLGQVERGKRRLTEDDFITISKNTGISIGLIKHGDLSSTLKKGDMCFGEKIPLSDVEKSLPEDANEVMPYIFPFKENDEVLANEDFKNGIDIIHKKIHKLDFTFDDCIEAINCFIRACNIEKCSDYSAINILSCFGYIYLGMVFEKASNFSQNDGIASISDLCSYINSSTRENKKNRALFLKNYDDDLITYMEKLIKNVKNADYAYYFLCMRYIYGIMDESITLMDENQMRLFGESLLAFLNKIGNRYAKAYFDFWEAP